MTNPSHQIFIFIFIIVSLLTFSKTSVSTNLSCSNNHTNIVSTDHHELALETLLLQLKAEVIVGSKRVSTGVVQYGNNGTKIYGLAKCVHFVSPKECEVCVEMAIEKLHDELCGSSKNGGSVAARYCFVGYDSYSFFGGYGTEYWESDGGDMGKEVRVRVLMWWGGGVVLVILVVVLTWLLRRSVINKARVASFGVGGGAEFADHGQENEMGIGNKGIV